MIEFDANKRTLIVRDNTITSDATARGCVIETPPRRWWKPFARRWNVVVTGNTITN